MTQSKTDSWATFFKTFQRLHQGMELELKKKKLPSLEIYDVLWSLENAPHHELRFYELADKVYLAKFNISRICQRLIKKGWIEKRTCPLDGRGYYAKITSMGLKMRKKIWETYGKNINENYSQRLNQREHKQLMMLLEKVIKMP
jgi:DNA-binding MarR family transcriptional regulator